jgi:hypothetical protein
LTGQVSPLSLVRVGRARSGDARDGGWLALVAPVPFREAADDLSALAKQAKLKLETIGDALRRTLTEDELLELVLP